MEAAADRLIDLVSPGAIDRDVSVTYHADCIVESGPVNLQACATVPCARPNRIAPKVL